MKLKEALALANDVDRYTPDTGEVDQYHFNEAQIEYIIANTVTAVLDEIEREVEEHGNRVLGLYGGRLPYTFFGGNEEDNRMQIYLAAHKDIIKTIIKSKRTEI